MRDILTSKEGYVYTNGETFSNIIRLGVNDSPDNWTEINDSEIPEIIDTESEE